MLKKQAHYVQHLLILYLRAKYNELCYQKVFLLFIVGCQGEVQLGSNTGLSLVGPAKV